MSEQLLTILKFCLLALIYLFFFRVLRAVWAEITPSKVAPAPGGRGKAAKPAKRGKPPKPGKAPKGRPPQARPPMPVPVPVPQGAPGPVAPAPHAGPYPAGPPAAPGPVAPVGAPMPAPAPAPGPGKARKRKGPGRLVVLEPPEQRGRAYVLDREVSVGRAAGCQITVDDTFVSQVHARVFAREGNYLVEDLGSTNGTYLNKRKVSGAMIMQRGDRLQVGNTVLELE